MATNCPKVKQADLQKPKRLAKQIRLPQNWPKVKQADMQKPTRLAQQIKLPMNWPTLTQSLPKAYNFIFY